MLSQYQDLVLPSLRRLVEHQHQGEADERYEARFLHSVVDQLRGRGIDLPAGKGPWTVGARWLRGPGMPRAPRLFTQRRPAATRGATRWWETPQGKRGQRWTRPGASRAH